MQKKSRIITNVSFSLKPLPIPICDRYFYNPLIEGFIYLIWSRNFWIGNLRIKYWSPSYADQRINKIPLRYPVVFRPCRDNFKWGIKHVSSNSKVPTLNIEIKRSKIYDTPHNISDYLQYYFNTVLKSRKGPGVHIMPSNWLIFWAAIHNVVVNKWKYDVEM